MVEDFDSCYKAASSRDALFDGWFVVAVASTGIYCWSSYLAAMLMHHSFAESFCYRYYPRPKSWRTANAAKSSTAAAMIKLDTNPFR